MNWDPCKLTYFTRINVYSTAYSEVTTLWQYTHLFIIIFIIIIIYIGHSRNRTESTEHEYQHPSTFIYSYMALDYFNTNSTNPNH